MGDETLGAENQYPAARLPRWIKRDQAVRSAPTGPRTRDPLRLSLIATAIAVVAVPVGLFGLAFSFFLVGLPFLAVGVIGDVVAIAAAVTALLALVRHSSGLPVERATLAAVLSVSVLGGNLYIADALLFAQDRVDAETERRAAAIPRLLPVKASPIDVVSYVFHQGTEYDTFEEEAAAGDRICGLMHPRVRRGCGVHPDVGPEAPDLHVHVSGNRALVTWKQDTGFLLVNGDGPATEDIRDRAVRLELSERGWELIDYVEETFFHCPDHAVQRHRDPWACPTGPAAPSS